MFETNDIIKNRYKIINKFGKSKMSDTFIAEDNQQNKKVVIKTVELFGLKDWKILDLFEREAKILEELNHPNVPKYMDYFIEERDNNIIYMLVYEYIEGKSLQLLLEEGYTFDSESIEDILRKMLNILKYLHNLEPPVIHRDIKPNNIIMKANKEIYLVDFGAVQDTISSKDSMSKGSTFVGTLVYMPIEQLLGQATTQSDLYSLGMTLITLLTGKQPNEFEVKNLKPDYLKGRVMTHIDKIINMMIEPDTNNRVKTAKQALYFLNNKNEIENKNLNQEDIDYVESNPTGRLNIRTFGDMIILTVNSLNKLERKMDEGLIKDTVNFILNNSWVFIFVFFFIFNRLRFSYYSYFFLVLLLIPSITRAIKRQINKLGDVVFKIDNRTLQIPNQIENPIPISSIADIDIKKVEIDNKIDLDIEISYYSITIQKKKIKLSNLSSEDAEFISTFLIKNIEKRKEMLA